MKMRTIFHIVVYLFAIVGFAFVGAFFAVKFGLTNAKGIIDNQTEHFLKAGERPEWAKGEEWQTFKAAALRDREAMERAARESGVSPRLIFAILAVEQLRLYHSDRELFKKAFYPLKLLGNQSQFSWGVMGLKQETARQIEENLKNPSPHQSAVLPLQKGEYPFSPFYLGKNYEHLLDFKTADPNSERFARIVDEENRYYSYLYSGLYLKQIMKQWEGAGLPIDERPEILATLFNIGFENSKPKTDPRAGGSVIEIAGKTYSFGGLAAEVYYSSELAEEFPPMNRTN